MDDFIAAAGSQKIGPAIVLKVMAGDKFNLHVNSWWTTATGTSPDPPINPLNDLLAALTTVISPVSGKGSAAEILNSGVLTPGATAFLNSQTVISGRPKAYVNWVLFDDQFRVDINNCGFEQVGVNGDYKLHVKSQMPVGKNGFLYIYVSNETPNIPVFFDNLQVTHVRGPILEETHYYPFGLTMAGISSKAAGKLKNKIQYGSKELQSAEFSDGNGLEEYDFGSRDYDPQIGRWMSIDAFADKAYSLTPYRYCFDNPLLYVDPDGRWEFQVDHKKGKDGKETAEVYLKLVAQKGDDIHTLSKQTGIKEKKLEKMKLGELNENSVITGGMGKSIDFARINEALNYTPEQCKDQNNCWNMSFEYSEGKNIATDGSYSSTQGMAAYPISADAHLKDPSQNYQSENSPESGDIVRFSSGCFYVSNNDPADTYKCVPTDPKKLGATSHYAIFLLKNDKGTQVFTKNGSSAGSYRVQYTSDGVSSTDSRSLLQVYGNPTGLGNDSPYYHKY